MPEDKLARAAGMKQNDTPCNKSPNEPSEGILKPPKNSDLQERQLNAVELLLQGQSDAQVAKQVGVTRVTVFRWRKSAAVQQLLENARQNTVNHSIRRMALMLEPALDLVYRQLSGDDPKSALRAAALLLRIASPMQLKRMAGTEQRDRQRAFDAELDAYINAPMPGQPGHPSTRPQRDEDEDEDEEDED